MRRTKKIFVFEGFDPDYSDGLAVAIAYTASEAQDMIREVNPYISNWGKMKVHTLKDKIAYAVSGGS